MGTLMNEILGRAEKLSSANHQDDFDKTAMSQSSQTSTFVGSTVSDNDLQSIFRASESLWNRASSGGIKRDMLFGEKGVVFGLSAPQLEQAVNVQTSAAEEDEIEADVRRVTVEAERAFFNHILLSKPRTALTSVTNKYKKEGGIVDISLPKVSEEFTNRRDLLFGDRIRKYVRGKKKKDIGELLNSVNDEPYTDQALIAVWSEVVAVLKQKMPNERDDMKTCALLVDNACDFLNEQYKSHMLERVNKNYTEEPRRYTSIKMLIEDFLKVSPDTPDCEDGVIRGLPVWEVAYHCFRVGDLSAASDALDQLRSFPQSACLVQALLHLTNKPRLDSDIKKKLRVEWRHNMSTIRDVYKKALYIALLGGDSTLADSMENWLWFKLITLRYDTQMSPALYAELQKIISVDYGEAYFMDNGGFQYYFTALWLSGQFERAIELLTNCGLLSEAVHVAVLTNELGYLRRTKNTAADLITADQVQPTHVSLNLPRLIVTYVKSFELTDPIRSLDYCFLLRGFKTPGGLDVFDKAVSRSVYLNSSKENIDSILGFLTPDFQRRPGFIDEIIDNPLSVIESVAEDTELSGQGVDAIHLYLLADNPSRASNLLASEISKALINNLQQAIELRKMSEEYSKLLAKAPAADFSTLATLVDLVLVFDTCRKGDAESTFQWLRQLRLLPIEMKSVTVITSEFYRVPEKVREVIPDLSLKVVQCLSESVQMKPNSAYINMVRAIVLYAATVHYKFPQHITSELLRLQASIAL